MANERMTPVEAAKQLGIRPQVVYGFIKHGRVRTFSNPAGKTDLVELKEVESVAKQVKHHRPVGSDGKPVRRSAGVQRGTLLSAHAHWPGEAKTRRAHKVYAVSDVHADDENNGYVWTVDADGRPALMYEEDHLAGMIAKKQCHIESPASLLGVIMFHWEEADQRKDLAEALRLWCEVNEVAYTEVRD